LHVTGREGLAEPEGGWLTVPSRARDSPELISLLYSCINKQDEEKVGRE
jgi:hypothetical protein